MRRALSGAASREQTSVFARQHDRQNPRGLPVVPRRFAAISQRIVVIIHLPEHGLCDRFGILGPVLGPRSAREPVDRAEIVLAIRIVVAVELGERDDRRRGGRRSPSSCWRWNQRRDTHAPHRSGVGWRRSVRGSASGTPPFDMGRKAARPRGPACPARTGWGGRTRICRWRGRAALVRPALMRRVPRLADYTGGRLSFGNERAAPLAFPGADRAARRPIG